MKKPIIKNWIKYFTVTLAVSGMLTVSGCDSNTTDQQETDYTTEVEAAENEVGQPTRDNVNQEVDADTYDTEDESDQPARIEGQEANTTTTTTEADNRQQTGNRSTAPRAQGISDMDSHLQEHSDANREATETLTEAENLEQAQAPGIHQGEIQDTSQTTQGQGTTTANEYENTDRNTYDQQGNTAVGDDMGTDTDRTTDMNQQGTTGMDEPTQQRNTLDNEQDANIGRQGTNTQGIPQEEETYQGRDAEAEVGTGPQGTTEMDIDRQQDTNVRQEDRPMDQQQGTSTSPTQTDDNNMNQNQQGTSTTPTQTDDNNMNQNQQGTDNQQPATYHQQGNNQQGVQQNEDGTGVIIYERYSITYPENYSEEDRQRSEDIMNEYETRRESMRGQMDEETGAYVSPEVEARPEQGYDQLMSQIQDNLNYPQDAAAAEMEGTIFVNFIVDENGNIEEAVAVDDVIVPNSSLRSATNTLDPTKFHEEEIEEARKEMRQAAVEAVKETSGQWQPGQQGGENVKSEVQIPVRFEMQNDRANTIPDQNRR